MLYLGIGIMEYWSYQRNIEIWKNLNNKVQISTMFSIKL